MKILCQLCREPTKYEVVAKPYGEIPALIGCSSCGLVRLKEVPSTDEIRDLYQESYYDAKNADRFPGVIERVVRLFRWLRMRDILKWEKGPASLLDVGCGRGVMLEMLQRRKWKVAGTQLSETAAAAICRRSQIEVHVGELTTLDLPPSSFRVITFYHVVEHLIAPRDYLRSCHELLEQDGLLVVEAPNYSSPGFHTLGVRNLSVDYPHHNFFFTPATLGQLLAEEGFAVKHVSHFSLEYSPFTTLQNMLNALPGTPNRFYDALKINEKGRRLRRQTYTWVHFALATLLALPALAISLLAAVFPVGNTIRFYCRKRDAR